MLPGFSLGRRVSRRLAVPAGQLAQALTNFLILLACVRELPPDEYVPISICWMVLVTLLNAQRVIVTEQAIVAHAQGTRWPRTAAVLSPAGIVCGAAFSLAAVLILGPHISGTGWAVLTLGFLVLVNDTVRYVNIIERQFKRLIAADMATATFALMGFLWLGVSTNVSVSTYLWQLGATFGGSFLVLGGFVRPRPSSTFGFIREMGSFALWNSLQVLVVNTLSQFTVLFAAPFTTTREFGGIRAMQSLFSPLSTPATALQPQVLGWLATRERRRGASWSWVTAWILLWFAVFAIFATLAAGLDHVWLADTIGVRYADQTGIVFPIASALGLVYVGLPAGMYMRVHRLGVQSTSAQFIAVLLGGVAIVLASWNWGVNGAAWAIFSQMLLSSVFAWAVVVWHTLPRRAMASASGLSEGGAE